MRLRTSHKIAAFAATVVIAGLASLLAVTDVNTYKVQIAEAIEAETGRQIEFGGDIELSVGRTTTLTINDVRLANAAGGRYPDMVRVAQATAEVAALPLWRGEIVINRLILHGAEVFIDIDERGATNFDFARARASDSDTAAVGDGGRHDFLLQRIDDVDIRDANFTVYDARTAQSKGLNLERLELRGGEAEELIRVAAKGHVNIDGESLPFDVAGRAGRIAALVARGRPYPLDVEGSAAGIRLSAAGTVADPFAATGMALRIDLESDDLSPVARLIGVKLPTGGPAQLGALLTGEPENFTLGDLSFKFGDSQVWGDLSFDLSGERLYLAGDISSKWLDLTPWLALVPTPPSSRQVRLINNDVLPFTALKGFDGELALNAETLLVPNLMFRDAAVSFELNNDQLYARAANARVDGRRISGDLTVDARAEPPAVSMELTAQDIDIGRLTTRLFGQDLIHGVGGMDLLIAGRGRTLAEIVGTSVGHVRVLMDSGEVRTGSLGLLVGGVSEILPGLSSGDGEWTTINCVAGDFDLHDGIATSRVALLDSEVLRLVGDGQINLTDDTLEFDVDPTPKSPTLNVAVPVTLSGSLIDPSVTPDEFSVLRRLGGLVGAVVFPPAALLSLGSLGSHDNPCLEAVQSAAAPQTAEAVDWNAQLEAEAPPEPAADGARRLIDAVKRLLPLRGNET